MKIKAVLFDLDGTVADSLPDLADGVNRILAENGYPMHETAEYAYFVGDGIAKMVERALPESARTPENIARCHADFMAHYAVHFADKTVPFDGVADLLRDLKKRGILLAVVTNKAQEMAEKVVKKLYGDLFDGIFGLCDGRLPKPHPGTAQAALEKFGIAPEETLFVGDSGVDMKTAAALGAFPVGVLWGYRTAEELTAAGAKKSVHTPSEIGELAK